MNEIKFEEYKTSGFVLNDEENNSSVVYKYKSDCLHLCVI